MVWNVRDRSAFARSESPRRMVCNRRRPHLYGRLWQNAESGRCRMGNQYIGSPPWFAEPPKPPGDPPPEPMGDPEPDPMGDPDPDSEPEDDPDETPEPISDPDEY